MRKQKQTPRNDDGLRYCARFISDLVIRVFFVIRHSDFVISF
jgi:hypothetical protein